MKIRLISTVMLSLFSTNSFALSSNDLLAFTAGVPTYDQFDNYTGVTGSYYGWDYTDDGAVTLSEQTVLAPGSSNGLLLGATMNNGELNAGSSYLGYETFFSLPDTPVSILSDDGAGVFELDFSGLNWFFNGNDISMGGNSALGDTGIATLTCSSTACINGDTYTLSYQTHGSSPLIGFDGVFFAMEMTGTVSSIPVPAAAWLFVSGLVGLFGLSRRKSA